MTLRSAPAVDPPPWATGPRAAAGRLARAESRRDERVRATFASLYANKPQFWSQLVTACVVLAYTASTLFVARPPSGYDSFWDGWIGNLATMLPLVPIGLRVATTARHRAAWSVMAAGIALYNVGNLTYLLHDQNLHPIPSPAPSDAAYLLSYACLTVGIVMLTQRNFGVVAASTRLDGAITGLAIGASVGLFWFDRVLAVSGQPLQVVVGMAYPCLDLVMIVALVSALAPLRYRPNRSTTLLLFGMTAFVVGDIVYLNQVAAGTYVQGTLLDASWAVGVWLIGLAAWPREERRSRPRRLSAVPDGASSVPIVFGALSVAVLGVAVVRSTPPAVKLMALGALALVVVRMAMTLKEVRGAEHVSFETARVDELTGLANRRAYFEDGEARFASIGRDQKLGVVVVDLDGFKEINDTLGHQAGDELLQIAAMRFTSRLGDRGRLARIGGDEFAGTFEVRSVAEAVGIAQSLASLFADPMSIDGMTVRVGGSVGVAMYPEHGKTQTELLRCADIAMYEAKREHALVCLYRPEDDVHTRDRLALVDDLRCTPWERDLVLHFQPMLGLATGRPVGVEALVRWRHPSFGLLYPDDFVPVCERSGMIRTLTRTVIDMAVAELARLDRTSRIRLQMSVNISRLDLLDEDLAGYVDVVLARHRVAPQRLTVEVTESSLSEDPAPAMRSIVQLRERGVRVSIDDFGVGYSSLSQLLELPVDELKIDKSFVLALAVDARARAVVTATVELAKAIGLTVVAEGIESSASLETIGELGVDVAQGYYVACPYTAAQLDGFLAAAPARLAHAVAALGNAR